MKNFPIICIDAQPDFSLPRPVRFPVVRATADRHPSSPQPFHETLPVLPESFEQLIKSETTILTINGRHIAWTPHCVVRTPPTSNPSDPK